MKSTTLKVFAVGATMSFAMPAYAQEHTLIISSWGPPTHVINAEMWPWFIGELERLTDGRVTAEVRYDLAPPTAQADIVEDGAADITHIFHGYDAGRFVGTQLIELPGYIGNAEAASVAFWRAYDEYLTELNEYEGFVVAGLFTHGPAQLHTIEPLGGLGDLSNMKIRLPGGIGGAIGNELGATGIQVPAPRVYETLASNVADGVFMNMDSRTGFNLTEVAPHVFEMPGGFYRGSLAVLVNEDAFERLPEDVQSILLNELFGEPVSRAFGAYWDTGDIAAREATLNATGNSITAASADDVQLFESASSAVSAALFETLSSRGIDGEAARNFIAEQMAAEAGSDGGN